MNTNEALSGKQKKHLRKIAHHLRPIVTLTKLDFTENALKETIRAMSDHELIKVKIEDPDKLKRHAIGSKISKLTNSNLIQTIGKCVVLYKASPEPNPKLSNVARYSFK